MLNKTIVAITVQTKFKTVNVIKINEEQEEKEDLSVNSVVEKIVFLVPCIRQNLVKKDRFNRKYK